MTGGGKNQAEPLDDVEQKVKDIIRLSVDGLPSIFDSDADFGDNNDMIGNIKLCCKGERISVFQKKGYNIRLIIII